MFPKARPVRVFWRSLSRVSGKGTRDLLTLGLTEHERFVGRAAQDQPLQGSAGQDDLHLELLQGHIRLVHYARFWPYKVVKAE